MVIHIFNSNSEWVAYIVNNDVFSAETNDWIGWLDGNDFYSPMGEYLGSLTKVGSVHRILRNLTQLPKFSRESWTCDVDMRCPTMIIILVCGKDLFEKKVIDVEIFKSIDALLKKYKVREFYSKVQHFSF